MKQCSSERLGSNPAVGEDEHTGSHTHNKELVYQTKPALDTQKNREREAPQRNRIQDMCVLKGKQKYPGPLGSQVGP